MTHYIENSKFYGEFQRFVVSQLQSEGQNINAVRQGIIDRYAARGIELDYEGAMKELAAIYVQSRLFNDEKAIAMLVKANNSIASEFITGSVPLFRSSGKTNKPAV